MKAKVDRLSDCFMSIIDSAISQYDREILSNKSNFSLILELYIDNNKSTIKLQGSTVIEFNDESKYLNVI